MPPPGPSQSREAARVASILERKARQMETAGRCPTCWHTAATHCICRMIRPLSLSLNVRFIIYVHWREWYCAGDDAKLLQLAAPEATEPPRAVVTPGQVEIRELFMQFSGDLYSDEPNTTREVDEYRISTEELDLEHIRSVLAQHLRFG